MSIVVIFLFNIYFVGVKWTAKVRGEKKNNEMQEEITDYMMQKPKFNCVVSYPLISRT